MYLYLDREDGFDDLPTPLKQGFGTPKLVISLELSDERPLARVDVKEVIRALRETGFFLQMPPEIDPEMNYGE